MGTMGKIWRLAQKGSLFSKDTLCPSLCLLPSDKPPAPIPKPQRDSG